MAKKRVRRGTRRQARRPARKKNQQQLAPSMVHAKVQKVLYPPGQTPRGIKALIMYSIVVAIFYLFYLFLGLYRPELFPLELFQQQTFFLYFCILFFLVAVIYGLMERKVWGYNLAMVWFGLSIVASLFSITIVDPVVYPTVRKLLLVAALSIIFLNGVILWYLYEKRFYFLSKVPFRPDRTDTYFVHILTGFWILIILLTTIIGVQFYTSTTTVADGIIEELRGTSIIHALVLCDGKQGQERDICYVVLATIYHEQDLQAICDRIASDFFKLTCLQVR